MRARLAAVAVVALLAAACSSPPPSARDVAQRIPGCHPRPITDVSVYATAEVTCDIGPWGTSGFNLPLATVWVAGFSSPSLERQWLVTLGTPSAQVPADGCVQGSGWAAAISVSVTPAGREIMKVARALGGRLVSTGTCY